MSHNKERAEKVCLNCGTDLVGRYCHVCGQENLEPKESLWHLITHYAYDITHFDVKFFATLKYLLIRPGYLPYEYLKGKRMSYLHPIRMYVFTSAFFFLIVFSMFHMEDVHLGDIGSTEVMTTAGLKEKALRKAKTKEDSTAIQQSFSSLEENNVLLSDDADTTKAGKHKKKRNVNFGIMRTAYESVKQYDSIQASRPEKDRDGWMARRMQRRNIEIWEKYHGNVDMIVAAWLRKFTHTIPQLLFLSLPLFSFVLWLLYIRWNEKYFYTGHIIFSLYLYIFYFIAYLVFFTLQSIKESTHWGIWGWIEFLLWLYMMYYMYKAMRNFYRQGRWKTFFKLLLLSFASLFIIVFLFVLFSVFSAFTV
ncbi:MAG: DUF3667 domain-containing protein [Bacteroidetes bacterium]|nr:DUF3667 domain-containing protein [Bacteroidota bacterium]